MFVGDMTKEKWFKRGNLPPKYDPPIDVEIRRATIDEIDKFKEIVSRRKIKKFRAWFKKGYDPFVALYNGKIIYYQWLAYSDFYDPFAGMTLKPNHDEVVPVDVYTVQEFKFKDIHLSANYRTVVHCKKIGRYKMIALSTPERFPLLKLLYERTKFAHVYPVKRIAYYRLFKVIKMHKATDFKDINV